MTVLARLAIAAAAFLAAATTSLGLAPAQAGSFGNAQWCAIQNLGAGDVVWDCQYRTVEECVPHVIAGNRGSCGINPSWVPPAAAPAKYRKRHS